MGINSLKLKLFKMTILNFKVLLKNYNLQNDTMNESQLQRIYNYPIYPRDCKIHSDKVIVNIDIGSMSGIHW